MYNIQIIHCVCVMFVVNSYNCISSHLFIHFSCLFQLGESEIGIVDGKATKKVFDHIQTIKVVGYFAPRDTALTDFEQAAAEFQGDHTIFLGTGRCGKFHIYVQCIRKLYNSNVFWNHTW